MKVVTDKKVVDRLLSRHVVETIVEKDLRKRLAAGDRLRVKLGVDPTTPDIHLGHSVPLKKLREFQDMGHQVVFIIGDYTSMIGDPTGKSKTRPMLTEKEIKKNAKTYLDQAGKILDMKKVEVHFNSEWFEKMAFGDVVRLAAQFTVARMIERDDFEKRLKEGTDVHMHELLYPMMQAYDSIMVKADVEIGGTDQRFNVLAGRELQKKTGERPQDCMFLGPILVGTDGVKKMSKSLGNYIGISDSPEDMYGKVMSVPDTAMWSYWSMLTDVDEKDIAAMRADCEKGKMNPRDAKAKLAREIVIMYHSAKAADAAEEHFATVFRKKEVPNEVLETDGFTKGSHTILDIVVSLKLLIGGPWIISGSEARRLIQQGGIKVDGEVVTDINAKIPISFDGVLIQKGKRHFVRVKARKAFK